LDTGVSRIHGSFGSKEVDIARFDILDSREHADATACG
jgi:hypothetical protein